MEFFGIGTWELMVVGLIALIVLGPKQMIILARRAGELLRQFQGIWQEASKTIDKEIKAIEAEAGDLTQLPKEFTALTNQVKNALTLDSPANGKTQSASPAQPEPSIRPPAPPSAWTASPSPMAAAPGNGASTESGTSSTNEAPPTSETTAAPASPEPNQPVETPVTYTAWTTKRN
jgi:Tat protein translocase TatB subunit